MTHIPYKTKIAILTTLLVGFWPAQTRAQVEMCTGEDPDPAEPCYRFLCNSVNSEGVFPDDGLAQSCDDETPTRWSVPTIGLKFDTQTLPSELSSSFWQNVISDSLSGWNSVSGSNLVLQNIGSASQREFGDNIADHEVFWINDQEEWYEKVGQGSSNALGITAPRYDGFREIFDGDIVMNGVPTSDYTWLAGNQECPSDAYCFSASLVLLHELGHLIGLGHPCRDINCSSWAVMAAVANPFTEVESLQVSDYAAAGVLYPGVPGGVGYGCDSDSDCTFPNSCSNIGGISYCTQECTSNADCPGSFQCDTNGFGVCVFEGTIIPGLGEACTPEQEYLCDQGLDCVGNQSGGICEKHCESDADCAAGSSCTLYIGNDHGGFCDEIAPAGLGEHCDTTVRCSTDLSCIMETQTSGFCRAKCNGLTGSGCNSNEHCFPVASESHFCLPAGNGQEGSSCEDTFDCTAGKICLAEGGDNSSHCYQRCDQGFTCSQDQACFELPGFSYCYSVDSGTTGNGDDGDDGDDGNGYDQGGGNDDAEPPRNDECNMVRGNFDCPDGQGCVEDEDAHGYSVCEDGAHGDVGSGGLCEENEDCNGGICLNGVCTRPCTYGCPGGYTCDLEAAPGGICRPESCQDQEAICDEGWNCVYSSADRHVCATASEGCSCALASGGSGSGNPTFALLLLGAIKMLVHRRRRPRWRE